MKNKKSNIYVPQIATIKELVKYGVEKGPDKKFLIFHNSKEEECTKTYGDFWDDVVGFGTFLFKNNFRDCKIAVIGENSYEWMVIMFAIFLGKNILVPLDRDMPAEDLAHNLISSGCKAVFYSEKSKPTVEHFKNNEAIPVEYYYTMKNFEDFKAEGKKALEDGLNDFIDQEVKPSDLACIVYTSGTTGRSKGVMLTHSNLANSVMATCQCMSGQNTVGFLPLHHTFSWIYVLSAFVFTEYGYICRDYRDVAKDFKTYEPQHFTAVPLVVEKIYRTIWRTAERTGKAAVLRKGLKISRVLMKLGIDKRQVLFKQIHDQLGGHLEMIFCGGAALDISYEKNLYDLGILVLNGYGITECSPVVSVNRADNYKFGSVGLPLPCCEIKIVDPDAEGVGEIYVKGSNVMVGYYNDPVATAEAFDGEWFKTGDYGRIDEDGFLFFVGRKKNLIVLPNGKNISPEELEDKLMKIPYVEEVLVYEDGRHIAAEFYLNEKEFPDAKQKLQADVDEFNGSIPMYKRITKARIRDTEFPKTTSLKIKRNYTSTGHCEKRNN